MKKKYYLLCWWHDNSAGNGKLDMRSGPFSIEELKSKDISFRTYVWYEGLNDWVVLDAKLRKELEDAERKEAASAKKFNDRISGRHHRRMDKILIASSIGAAAILLATVGLGWTIAIAIAVFAGIVLFL